MMSDSNMINTDSKGGFNAGFSAPNIIGNAEDQSINETSALFQQNLSLTHQTGT